MGPPHTGFVLSDRGAVPATDRFERRMRTVQKSIDPMSSTCGTNSRFVARKAEHMRKRWRAIRFAPTTPPRLIMRTSNAAHNRAIEPMMNDGRTADMNED